MEEEHTHEPDTIDTCFDHIQVLLRGLLEAGFCPTHDLLPALAICFTDIAVAHDMSVDESLDLLAEYWPTANEQLPAIEPAPDRSSN